MKSAVRMQMFYITRITLMVLNGVKGAVSLEKVFQENALIKAIQHGAHASYLQMPNLPFFGILVFCVILFSTYSVSQSTVNQTCWKLSFNKIYFY